MGEHRTFSAADFKQFVLDGYQAEIESLTHVAASKQFAAIVNYLANYASLVQNPEQAGFGRHLLDRYPNQRSLNVGDTDKKLEEVFSIALLASCMYLFEGEEIRLAEIGKPQLARLAEQSIKTHMAGNPKNLGKLAHRLHNTDAIRTMHILKLLGLLCTDPTRTTQLSLGSGHGSRDLISIHQLPGELPTDPKAPNHDRTLHFLSHSPDPQDVILVDNDPGFGEFFEQISKNSNGKILAINKDTDIALQLIAEKQKQNILAPRNLVVAFRIDHRMLPDVPAFFDAITSVISPQADFIMSMGAGHDESEFLGRTNKIQEIRSFLVACGHSPTHICLHQGKTLAERRQRPAFGGISFATHEILYCKLDRKNLSCQLS